MSAWMIYLFMIADNVNTCMFFMAIIFGMASIITFMISPVAEDYASDFIKWGKRMVISFFACIFLLMIFPNTKQLAAIYLIPKIANNEHVQQVPDNVMKLLNAKLQEWLNDSLQKGEKK